MAWSKKSLPISGSVLFRGTLPPRASSLRLPADATLTMRDAPAAAHWAAEATSPTLGTASLTCLRDQPPMPPATLVFDAALTDAEKGAAALGGTFVTVRVEQARGDLLRDRKRLLAWLGALFDDDGLIAIDHASTRGWSRAMLDDELAHDADVDVSALYALHAIAADGRCDWLHTHGLAELGKVDFDVIRPAESLTSNASDLIRALAFAVLEDRLDATSVRFRAFGPGGEVAAVDAATFDRRAPADERAIRDMGPDDDGSHARDRIVLVDPPRCGWLARTLLPRAIRASAALSNVPGDRALIYFSHDASALAAARARGTWPLFLAVRAELAEFELPAIAKLAYRVDGGGPLDLEHLWFEVHDADADTLDATLQSSPFDISAMRSGQRARREVERLSDWQIQTPLGSITPRNTTALRVLRADPALRERVREIARESRSS